MFIDLDSEEDFAYDLDFFTEQVTIYGLLEKRVRTGVCMKPIRHNPWDETKRSRFIESLMLRIPVPPIYFDGANDSSWLVIDGFQRLDTLKSFILDRTMKLTNLEYFTCYNNYYFKQLPNNMQRRIEETYITIHVIKAGTPENIRYSIYNRINP